MDLFAWNKTLSLLGEAYLSPYLPDNQGITLVYFMLFHPTLHIIRLIWAILSFTGSAKSLKSKKKLNDTINKATQLSFR